MKLRKHLPFFTLLLLILAGFQNILAQDAAAAAAPASTEQMNIIQTILHGGPLIVMIWLCIVATSVTMVTFIIQLFLSVRNESLAPKALFDSLDNTLRAGNYQEAWEICNQNRKVYLAGVLKGGLERVGRGREATETSLIEHGVLESSQFKTKNSYLSVIGVIAPMIGLLGTVIGMMGAFAVLGTSGVADPRALALRIGEVLMATASGLFIAIPAFIFYYYFRNKMTIVIVYADDKLNRLIEDIPFAELEGMRIGENFEAAPGVPSGRPAPGASESLKVSMALTTNCPICNGAITAGQNPCPHCGATLEWQ